MKKCRLSVLLLAIIISFSACGFKSADDEKNAAEQARFSFIDVGQGDCALISYGDKNILIDAGTTESGRDISNFLFEKDIDSIDCFIGTHPHEDHLGGAAAVLSEISAEKIFLNGDDSTSYFFERFADILLEKKINPVIPDMGRTYETGPFKIKFLSPEEDFGNKNDNSLVCIVEYGNVKALFMGDAERKVEAELLKSKADIGADILKVGHHGSRYGSSAEFLAAVSPSVAVIQSGKDNSYGHPHQETLDRLKKCGTEVMRCDVSGTVELFTDGERIYGKDGKEYVKRKKAEYRPLYIGNKKSGVFHCEACPNLPGEKNRVDFENREEAVFEGYAPCGNCNP